MLDVSPYLLPCSTDDLGYSTITEHIIEGDDESIYSSLGEAKEKGFRTILLSTNRPAFLNDVARIADDLGILGDSDYLWIISGAAFPTAMRDIMKYEVDSPTDKVRKLLMHFLQNQNHLMLSFSFVVAATKFCNVH